jgi:hypothetical protein
MFKKIIAYIFIFIANLVLLAHAVVPHHHHHHQICIQRTTCNENDNNNNHSHKTSASDHEQSCNTDLTKCLLKQAFVVPSTQSRIIRESENDTNFNNQEFCFISILGQLDLSSVLQNIAYISQLPPILKSIVTVTNGLRAPPMC